MAPVAYLLDANVFIEAARRYYAFDLAPGFWASLSSLARRGKVISIDRVKSELDKGNDELADWARSEFLNAFVSTDDTDVIQSYSLIIKWVTQQSQFLDAAKADFAAGADGWLVAFAKIHGNTIVTREVLAPDVRKKVPIPNVCAEFSVPYIDTFSMLRTLGVRFS